MNLLRKQDLSIYYWLIDNLPTFVTVVDAFPEEELALPTVSIDRVVINERPYQLGGQPMDKPLWVMNVFAKDKSQRDDFAYHLYTEMLGNIPVYNYDEGFPPSVTPTQLGVLKCYGRTITPIKVFPELVRTLYWRSAINFWTEYEQV